ncbi:SCO family protein [Polaromonas sp.]|uniref:SCO family protein n=1 Tax=Polaromonas sp. TaxID=1869339 RepID=UPI00286A0138|nr:SCO family protein [Polaromonas sp.]
MPQPQLADPPLARRLTLALCAALLLAFGWGLYRYTAGFEVWTFEGQRQMRLAAGSLRAPALALRSAQGAPVTLWQASGNRPAAYLVDFIYTRCPGVCRALGSDYQQMQAQLAAQRGASTAAHAVQLVSISFDTAHDDAVSLLAYAREHRADPALWTVAMPASAADAAALLRSLDVIAIPDGLGGFVHNGAIHLLDGSGRLRGLYALEQWREALDAAQALATTPREAAQ